MKRISFAAAMTAAVLLAAAVAGAQGVSAEDRKTVGAEIARLEAEGKYLSAARRIRNDAALFRDPEFFWRYVDIVTERYVGTDRFRSFTLKDLGEGETVRAARAHPENGTAVEEDLAREIESRLANAPEDPYLNLAQGTRLSRAMTDGQFAEDESPPDEYPFFRKAFDSGVYTAWSLFRIGAHQQDAGTAEAETFYRKALSLEPGLTPARFNLGVLLFVSGNFAGAREEAEKTLDRYGVPELDADTHHLMARIEEALGNDAAAEKHYRRSLGLNPWGDPAFADFLLFYGARGKNEEYEKLALDSIGRDLSNPHMFNAYVDVLARRGVNETDRRILSKLSAGTYEPAEEGPVFFNLGRAADADGDPMTALKRYERSLAAFSRLPSPPPQALESLGSLMDAARAKIPLGPRRE